jgi:N6-L-threonylcarbamoyladenine synthase
MILALESSCDETAVALFDPSVGLSGEWVHSQIALHEAYGGVVPDLASREHLEHFGPLLQRALTTIRPETVTKIAVTNGPGLAACLAMGLAAAKSLGLAWRVPVVGVNHLRAHAFSPFIGLHAVNPPAFDEEFAKLLPHLGLLVSGGNTLLFSLDEARHIKLLASTMDDAAGEALDKGAKLLGLGYPGGPQVERLAAAGSPSAFSFPKAVAQRSTLEFSFSGLKTSLRYQLEKMPLVEIERCKADLCASYQAAVFDALVRKSRLALERGFTRPDLQISPSPSGPPHSDVRSEMPLHTESAQAYRSFGLSGGVANNRTLQALLERMTTQHNVPFFRAEPKHTGDNAGMIAFAAWIEREPRDISAAGLDLEIAPSLPLAIGGSAA